MNPGRVSPEEARINFLYEKITGEPLSMVVGILRSAPSRWRLRTLKSLVVQFLIQSQIWRRPTTEKTPFKRYKN